MISTRNRRRALFEALESRTLLSTYYLATNGSDSGSGSSSSPFASFNRAYTVMSGGDTLIVKNGTYNNKDVLTRTVRPPSGSASGYTVVKAETPGGVVIDGHNSMSPISMDGPPNSTLRYIQIDGIVFRRQGWGATLFGVDHLKFTRDGFEDSSDGNAMTFLAGKQTSYILVEDCFAWGSGRYKFATYHSDHVIFRRDVVRFDRAVATPDPIASFAIYASDRVELQNCISIDGDHSEYWQNVDEYSGSYSIPSTDGPSTNINITGSLSLNVDMQFGTLSKDLSNINISNSVGWDIREGVLARDSANYDHMTFGDIYGPARQTQTVGLNWVEGSDPNNTTSMRNSILTDINGTALTNWNSEDYNVFYSNNKDRTSTPTGSHSTNANPNLSYILDPSRGASSAVLGKASHGGNIGATITKRIGVSGTMWGESGYDAVTGEDLWPWPNEDIIGTFMRSYQYQNLSGNRGFAATGQTLTNYVWTYLGNPNPFSGGSNPTAPSAPSSLSASAVSAGQINLSWNDNSYNETGFLVERQTGGGAWTQIASLGANTTSYSNSGLSASTSYSYRVRATNSVGNSGYSNTASATTPQDPPAGAVAITSATFHYDTMPNTIVYRFNTNVFASVNIPDVTVTNLGTGQSFYADAWSWNGATNEATFRFDAPLADGNYRATFRAEGVWDTAGNMLPSAHVMDFFSLRGDINRDRAVNALDLGVIANHWSAGSASFSDGDLNGDSLVNASDLTFLATNWQMQLPAGAAAPAALATAASTPFPGSPGADIGTDTGADTTVDPGADTVTYPAPQPDPGPIWPWHRQRGWWWWRGT